jgi:hypothetical protein
MIDAEYRPTNPIFVPKKATLVYSTSDLEFDTEYRLLP